MNKTTKTLVRSSLGIFGLLVGITYGIACGGSESTNEVPGCTPNATQACTGPGACMGSQTCAADGKSWSMCDCGGGSSSTSGPGSGGATTTTTTGPGGAGPGTGGAGPGTGGAGQGGTMTTGAGGMPTTGTGPNPACPMMEPMMGDACTDPQTGCNYDTSHCECWPQMMGGTSWDCDNCPMAEPNDGDGCGMFGGQRCFYGGTTCYCPGGGGANWNCSTCPATQPMSMDSCMGLNGAHCAYGQTACSCVAFGGGGESWFCF